jgi:putative PIN family toxin of toxin-antitoxin system
MNPGPAKTHLRVVLDTNIYIAAFGHPEGPNAEIWAAALTGRYYLLVSRAIIIELARVLREDFMWQEERIQRRLKRLVNAAEIVTTGTAVHVVAADPSDNRILECAVDGRADLIVSNDHHLLDLNVHEGIPIVAGPDFRRTLGIPSK